MDLPKLSDMSQSIPENNIRRYPLAFLCKLSFLLIFVSISGITLGQSVGDYRTSGSGTTWSTVANWQRYAGAILGWQAPGLNGYPGQTAGAGTVTILSGQAMTADVSPANSLGNLATVGTSTLNLNTGITLTVSGTLTVDGTSQINGADATSTINTATFSAPGTANAQIGALTLTVSGTSTIAAFSLSFTSNIGVKTFKNTVSNNGNWHSTSITTSANLVFQGGIVNNGPFGTGGATFNTNNQSLTGGSAFSCDNNLVISGIVLTNSNTGTFTIAGTTTITGAGGFIDSNNFGADVFVGNVSLTGTSTFTTTSITTTANLTFRGGITNGGSSFTAGSATFDTNAQTITGATSLSFANNIAINNIVVTNASTGTFTVGQATTLTNGGFTDTDNTSADIFIGTVSQSGTSAFNTTAVTTNGNLIFRNGITNNGGTFTAGAGDFTTNNQTLSGTNDISFANYVNVTGVTVTNSNSLSVSLTRIPGGGSTLNGTGTWTQGANSTLNYTGDALSVTTFNATAAGNTVNYNGGTQTILPTSYYNLTYSGTVSGTVTTASVAGNLTASSGAFISSGTITLNGSSLQTLSGPGTFTFVNLTANNTATAPALIDVNQNIPVSGVLTLTAGVLVVNSTSNITIGSGGSISGAGANQYIQLDGSTAATSNLIITNNASTAKWAITYPIGTSSGGYTPVSFPTVTTTPVNNSTLSIKAIYNQSDQGLLRRTFRLVVTGNASATTFTNGLFKYNNTTDISSGDAESNYTTEWYLATSTGSWTNIATIGAPTNQFTVAGGSTATASLGTGTYYYTIGTAAALPNTWYSYQTGVWSNWQNWTSDPSGSSLVNGLNLPPQPGDAIVILNGITITNDVSGQVTSTSTINAGATLDMAATSGNTLGIVSGAGLLRIGGASGTVVALPTGTYTNFVAATTGGTIEFYNATPGTYTLPTAQTTYNNLKLTTTTSAVTFVEANNLTVNGTFNITSSGVGTVTWQINDNSANQRTIVLNGDLIVSTNGQITAGTGNSASTTQHSLTLNGNLTNNGVVKFFDPTQAPFTSLNTSTTVWTYALVGNAVNVTFSGASDATVTCNGVTDFYRLILNKGTGQQAILTVNSSSTANLQFFGPSNLDANHAPANTYDYTSNNTISIVNGTLQLTGSINIPVLQVNDNSSGYGYTPIPRNGALWLNGANVTIQLSDNSNPPSNAKDARILISGLLRVTAGTINNGFGKGLGSQDGGTYFQEGGTVNCWQFRPKATGTGVFSYVQTGGTLNVGYGFALSGGLIDQYETSYCRFDLNSTTSTFQMSGSAILNVAKPTQNNANPGTPGGGLFHVISSASNVNVTGGTVNFYMGLETATNSWPGYITSTAGLYNVNIYEESATAQAAQLESALVVLNNLYIDGTNAPVLTGNNNNLTIGGNFTISTGSTYTPGSNTITFNGSAAQTWTYNGTLTSLSTVAVSKSGTLTLAGNTLPNIATALTLTSGTLEDGGSTVTVTGALTNNATHTSTSGAGMINVNGATTIGGTGGTFGNLRITTNSNVTVSGNQTVSKTLTLVGANSSLTINANSLVVNTITAGVAFGTTCRIVTSGNRNDGGLTLKGVAGNLLFPVGTSVAAYSPITINVTASTYGTITVCPVKNQHPNVVVTGVSLNYFWRVVSAGYSGITAVAHNSYTFNSTALLQGTAAQINAYSPARFDATTLSWFYQTAPYNATGTTAIPNFNTNSSWSPSSAVSLDGEYTAGNQTAFTATASWKPFYSSGTTTTWSLSSSWSTVAVGSTTNPSNQTPCSTCPVVIGDATHNHTINILSNNTACGSLFIASGSTLDCGTATGLNFGVNTSGTGTLRISSSSATPAFPTGDFTNFLSSSGGTVEWYSGVAAFTIPSTASAPANLINYYNLKVTPATGFVITMPATDLTIYNNFTTAGSGQINSDVTTARNLTINNNFLVSSGTFLIRNSNSTAFTVNGGTTVTGNLILQGGGTRTHTFTTPGGITNNGTLTFLNGNEVVNLTFTGTNNVSIAGTGTAILNLVTVNKGTSQTPSVTLTEANVTAATNGWLTLTNGSFIFNNGGTYSISSSNTGYTIPSTANLTVQSSGTVTVVNANNTGGDLFLNGSLTVSGTATVNIGAATAPGVFTNNIDNDIEYGAAGTPTINVSGGTLNVGGSIRRSTSSISGALVHNQTGGAVYVGGNASNNTRGVFEIDSNSGSSFTFLNSSSLTVQKQTNGTGYADVFINPSSSNVSPTSTISVGLTTATTQTNLRVNIAPSIGNFTVLGPGASANPQTVNLFSNPMILGGNLTITTPSILNTNSLNVSIAGNLTTSGTGTGANSGTYNGGTNTTTFNGTANQSALLTFPSTFTNLTISNTGGSGNSTVQLATGSTSPSLTNLSILSGTLDVNNLALTVSGNITNNGIATNSGGNSGVGTSTQTASTLAGMTTNTYSNIAPASTSGVGTNAKFTVVVSNATTISSIIVTTPGSGYKDSDTFTFNGSQFGAGTGTITFQITSLSGNIVLYGSATAQTITCSNGTFNNLAMAGTATSMTATVNGNMSITGILDFGITGTTRYLFIGSSLLTFGSSATIVNGGTNRYIKTNGVSSDLGVIKTWPVGTNSFTYALGTRTNYTPITLTNLVVTTSGNYNIIPVDAAHPTSSPTGPLILDYYWKVIRDNSIVHGPTGTLVYQVPTGLIGGSGGTLIGAYLDAVNLIGWTAGGVISVSGSNTLLTFTNSFTGASPTAVLPAAGGEFDYTYGTTTTLPNPITPVYSRFSDAGGGNATQVGTATIGGSWDIATSWTLATNGLGGALSSVPTNRPVVILPGARINLDVLGQSAFKTQLSGLLVVTTVGHNIGTITGTGTMRTSTSTLPAGTYTTFTASGGGTIEYIAPMTMNSISTYNNLSLYSGSAGTVTMTASNLTINGNVNISSGTVLDNTSNNANISLSGNWTDNGTFNAGTGTVTFAGTTAQTITGTTSFNNLTMAATANTTLSGTGTTTVNGALTMNTGDIISSSTNLLTLGSSTTITGGSTSSYISGPMAATINSGKTLSLPLGDITANYYRPAVIANTTASDTWSAQYFAKDPTTGGFPYAAFNSANMQKVSQFEYWTISPSSSSTFADLTLLYNTGSYNGANIGTSISTLLLAHWSSGSSQWDLPVTGTGSTITPSGNTVTGTVTVTNIQSFSPFTFGSTDPNSTLPIGLVSFTGTAKKYGVDLQWTTASETNNDYFTVSHSVSGTNFEPIGTVKGNGTTNVQHTYTLTDYKPVIGNNYYQLKQTDFDGHSTSTEFIVVDVLSLEPMVAIYPNPLSRQQALNVIINGLQSSSQTELQIVNMQGITVKGATIETDSDGALKTSVAVSNLSPGLYILKVQNVHFKFVVE